MNIPNWSFNINNSALEELKVSFEYISSYINPKNKWLTTYLSLGWYEVSKLFNWEIVINWIEFRKNDDYSIVFENWDWNTWNRPIKKTDLDLINWVKEEVEEFYNNDTIKEDEDTLNYVYSIMDWEDDSVG